MHIPIYGSVLGAGAVDNISVAGVDCHVLSSSIYNDVSWLKFISSDDIAEA